MFLGTITVAIRFAEELSARLHSHNLIGELPLHTVANRFLKSLAAETSASITVVCDLPANDVKIWRKID